MLSSKCVIPNYIPHETPMDADFNEWYKFYKRDLINLYMIFQKSVDERYNNTNVEWRNNETYTKFVYMIFKSSSKYIPKY